MRLRAGSTTAAGFGLFGVLVASAWQGNAQGGVKVLGGPLPGLTPDQLAAFVDGKSAFVQVRGLAQGLGPIFNGRSCAECHIQGGVGGSGDNVERTSVRHFGRLDRGRFDPMEEQGGSLLQSRSIRELDPALRIRGETIPKDATIRGRRISTSLFGAGLIEAIPDADIIARADPADADHDGISGRANVVWNRELKRSEVGRFGWKAKYASLHMFAGDALLNEMGITSRTFPSENLPQKASIQKLPNTTTVFDDDGRGVDAVTAFVRYLAPPVRGPMTTTATQGERVFQRIGCVSCHTASMVTGPDNAVEALRSKAVSLYSDLLLHDMGPALADGIKDWDAEGNEFRTAPLWGVGQRAFWLHDGRARSLQSAIILHGGEGKESVTRFKAMARADRAALIAFLRSL